MTSESTIEHDVYILHVYCITTLNCNVVLSNIFLYIPVFMFYYYIDDSQILEFVSVIHNFTCEITNCCCCDVTVYMFQCRHNCKTFVHFK
jgi:hypothetical protein